MPGSFIIFGCMSKSDLKSYCPATKKGTRKGRSESRMQIRDEKMAYRFYYHAEICNLNYSIVLSTLSREFDLDESVITNRLKKIEHILGKVFKEKPSIRSLRKKYPYYSWQAV